MLKAGIMKDYRFEDADEGAGKGSLCGTRHNEPYAEDTLSLQALKFQRICGSIYLDIMRECSSETVSGEGAYKYGF